VESDLKLCVNYQENRVRSKYTIAVKKIKERRHQEKIEGWLQWPVPFFLCGRFPLFLARMYDNIQNSSQQVEFKKGVQTLYFQELAEISRF